MPVGEQYDQSTASFFKGDKPDVRSDKPDVKGDDNLTNSGQP